MKAFLTGAALLALTAQGAFADPTVLRFTPLTQSGTAAYDDFYKPWSDKVSAVSLTTSNAGIS